MENIKRVLGQLRQETEDATARAEKAEMTIKEKDRAASEKDQQIENLMRACMLTAMNEELSDKLQSLQERLRTAEMTGDSSIDLVREAESKIRLAEQEAEAWEKKYLAAKAETDKYKRMLEELEGEL